ncbi:ABC transporter substrate-binding protein [Arthrobacter sp. APC 3897]|uniref:ABC transporter substrate-binding protein n=1 Tax=Arthrobacter sp. APC 3897 TaxID=3035204 RepID=UPI0025B3309E|nr:ABC transporter substrate-binding protein [Arthrobacter sp. APC 3897]MDN3483356.1 ABC transporter substrate-binding protein [Arthrobacter sp. APC 3897]
MPEIRGRDLSRLAAAALLLTVAAGCVADPENTGEGAPLVLADANELGRFNPVGGHGDSGQSQIYDGLLRLAPRDGSSSLPDLIPWLATEMPRRNTEGTEWTVRVRDGVEFTDGTVLDAEDVAATYKAVIDPASASELAPSYDMLQDVTAGPDGTVTFTLKYPYSGFASRLLLGIAPSERLMPGLAAESSLNTDPVGTGPYTLASLRPDELVLTANEDYWNGAPEVKTVTIIHVPDDNSRAQRLQTGEIDGTVLPPSLAAAYEDKPGYSQEAVETADWRGLSLPAGNAFASDPQAVLAMNLAVDREAMVDHVLAGRGVPAHTPVAAVYGDAFDPDAVFPFDPEGAKTLLDEAGWVAGEDGKRTRDGVPAAFDLAYNASDTLRRDLSLAFASDMSGIGVDVTLLGTDWNVIEERRRDVGILLGGGDKPYDLDSQLFETLHTAVPGTGSPFANPGNTGSAEIDAHLEAARTSTDPAERTARYLAVQDLYVQQPGYVMLAFINHNYIQREMGWQNIRTVLEPHAHDVGWGFWWSLRDWTRE